MSGFGIGSGAGTGGGFSFSGLPTTTSAPSTGGFSFSTPSTSSSSGFKFPSFAAPSTTNSTPGNSSFSFNLNTSSTGTVPIASSSTGAVPVAGGSSLFNLPSSTVTATSETNSLNFSKPAAAPILLGSTPSTASFSFAPPTASTSVTVPQLTAKITPLQTQSLSSQVTPTPTTTSSTFSNFGFGIKPNATNPTSAPLTLNTALSTAAPAQPPAGALSVSFGPSATLSTSTTTTSFGASGAGGATNLSMRQLEERLNKWLVELKEQEERFVRQAAHVNSWDQILQSGHDQVQSLKDTLHTVKSDQSRLEAEIDFIRGQQEELERLLDTLESTTNANPATQLHQGDRQRDNMYYLAQSLDATLRQMTDDLGKVIEHLNTNSGSWQPNDPVTLVARILSAHMDTLKWVDQNTTLLSQKMEDVARVAASAGKRG